MIGLFRSPPEAKGTYSEVSSAVALWQEHRFLEEFCKVRLFPGQERVPLTRWEKIKSYLPFTWRSNHETKIINKPLEHPVTIKFYRSTPYIVEPTNNE